MFKAQFCHQHLAYSYCCHHPHFTDKKTEAQDSNLGSCNFKSLLSKCQPVHAQRVLHSLPFLDFTGSRLDLGSWLVWLSGLSTGLQTKRSTVRFPVRAHAWVECQVPSKGCVRGNHTLMSISLSSSLTSPLSKNK